MHLTLKLYTSLYLYISLSIYTILYILFNGIEDPMVIILTFKIRTGSYFILNIKKNISRLLIS